MEKHPETLLPKIACGDQAAVASCIDCYGGLIWSVVSKMINDPAQAEDVVQEVFIDLWKNAHRYDPALSSETTFITMISRRRSLDHLRKQKNPLPTTLTATQEQHAPDTLLAMDEDAQQIRQLIDDLDPPKDQAIRLAICEGFSHAQVAKMLDLPLGSVKTHIRRGLDLVRNHLRKGMEVQA